jgi:hypothetical protein
MAARLDPQLALDERAVNDPDLESALERRLRAQDDVAEARGVFKTADDEVRTGLDAIPDFGVDTALRIGRFRITKTHREGGLVSFERKASDRIAIGLIDEDGASVRRPAIATGPSVSDDEDLRPTGEVNAAALRGEADRATVDEPTPIRRKANIQPPAPLN